MSYVSGRVWSERSRETEETGKKDGRAECKYEIVVTTGVVRVEDDPRSNVVRRRIYQENHFYHGKEKDGKETDKV